MGRGVYRVRAGLLCGLLTVPCSDQKRSARWEHARRTASCPTRPRRLWLKESAQHPRVLHPHRAVGLRHGGEGMEGKALGGEGMRMRGDWEEGTGKRKRARYLREGRGKAGGRGKATVCAPKCDVPPKRCAAEAVYRRSGVPPKRRRAPGGVLGGYWRCSRHSAEGGSVEPKRGGSAEPRSMPMRTAV